MNILVSTTVKNEFARLGAIHSTSSSVHSGPPSTHGNKRNRKRRGKGTDDQVDLADSNEEDEEGPFTLKSKGGKEVHKHIMTIRHERPTASVSSTNSTSSLSSSTGAIKSSTEHSFAELPSTFTNRVIRETERIDKKIAVLESIIATFTVQDPAMNKYQEKKRELLLRKLELYEEDFQNEEA